MYYSELEASTVLYTLCPLIKQITTKEEGKNLKKDRVEKKYRKKPAEGRAKVV